MERSRLNIFVLLTTGVTFILILAGSLVTSTGSGLAVPDWPLSFGQLFPKMEGGVLFEHSHRMIAGIVLILATILTIWLWKSEGKSKVSILSTIALGMVLIQALLGGITVLYGLPSTISILHATIAQTFFSLMIAIALFTSPWWNWQREEAENHFSGSLVPMHRGLLDTLLGKRKRVPSKVKPLKMTFRLLPLLSISISLLLYLQLILGASFRHGLGIRPLYAHILNGFLVAILGAVLFLYIGKKFKEQKTIYRTGALFFSLLMIQIILGVGSLVPLFGNLKIFIFTAHIGVGALLLAASLVISLLIYKGSSFRRNLSPDSYREKPESSQVYSTTGFPRLLSGE